MGLLFAKTSKLKYRVEKKKKKEISYITLSCHLSVKLHKILIKEIVHKEKTFPIPR